MNWRIIAIGALLLLPLLWALGSGFGNNPHEIPSVLLDIPAPDFELLDINSAAQDGAKPETASTIKLSSLRGTPVVLNFWSTWCQPCKVEHGILQAASRHFGEDVHFLGVVYQDETSAARQYLRSRGNEYPQLEDPGARTAIDYGVAGVPESFFIDTDGIIRFKVAGAVTAGVLERELQRLMATGDGN